MALKRIAVFGGGFNPPGKHHLEILLDIIRKGFRVILVPSGSKRPDKTIKHISPEERITLMKLGFGFFLASQLVQLDCHDLENGVFTRTHELQRRYEKMGEIWHLVGADWIVDGRLGKSRIQLEWVNGPDLWQNLNFLISQREGYGLVETDLPPHNIVLPNKISGSSTLIRERIAHGEPITGLVMPEVEGYILKHGLYLPKGAGR